MRLLEEVSYDLDFRKPRVICEEGLVIMENVQSIVMLTDSAVTVHNGSRFSHREKVRKRPSASHACRA